MKTFYLSIIAILLFPVGINGISYAQYAANSPPMITLWTDKPDYIINDTVTVSGYVDKSQMNLVHNLNIAISTPNGQWYKQDQFPVGTDGRFSYQFKIEGGLAVGGHYLVRVWSLEDQGLDVGTSFNIDSFINSTIPSILVKQGSTEVSQSGDNITESIEYDITVMPGSAGQVNVDVYKNTHLLQSDTLGTPYLISFNDQERQYWYKLNITGKKDLDIYKIDFRYDGKTVEKVIPLAISINGIVNTSNMQSPLAQLRSGVASHEIQCGNGFQLITKSEDGTPACVRFTSIDMLLHRGWTRESSDPNDTYMDLKVYGSYTPRSLHDHFLSGTLYSLAGPMPFSNVTISVNDTVMGTTRTLPGGCFQFNDWNDTKLNNRIERGLELDKERIMHGPAYLEFEAHYMGDSDYNPSTATANSYLYFYAVPLAPPMYDTEIYPSYQLNVTQGGAVPFHITVKPLSKYWQVEHMNLNLQRIPCGLSYSILPVDNADSALENSTARFDGLLNTMEDTPPGTYWISINEDLAEANRLHIGTEVGSFTLNVLPMKYQ